jgi:hypothetical protein
MLHIKEKDIGSISDQFSPEEVNVFLDKGDVSMVNHEMALFLQTINFINQNLIGQSSM